MLLSGILFLAVTGLVCIVVFGQKGKAIGLNVEGKTRPTFTSPSPSKWVSVFNEHPDANMSAVIQYVPSLGVTQSGPDRYVDRHRFVVGINDQWFFGNEVIGERRKSREWEWQEFYPSFVPTVIRSRVPNICQIDMNVWVFVVQKIGNWITARARGELGTIAHFDLISNGLPLKDGHKNINSIDSSDGNGHQEHIVALFVGVGFLASALIVAIRVADAICENRVGVLHVTGMAFYFIAFVGGELLLIWNLARLIAQQY
jgi:hypothetical protein